MRIRTPLLALAVLFLVGVALTWLAGSTLIAVRGQAVGPAPWPQAQAVSLPVDGGMPVEGCTWRGRTVSGKTQNAAILEQRLRRFAPGIIWR